MKRWSYQRKPDYDLNPNLLPPNMSVPELAPRYIKPKKHWLLPAGMAIVLVSLSGLGFWRWQVSRNTPLAIFDQALMHSLDTQQVKQLREADSDRFEVIYDLREAKSPHTSTLIAKTLGADTYIRGYGTLKNTYLSYASNPAGLGSTPTALLDQWISVRVGGKLNPAAIANPVAAQVDPRAQLLGPWIVGRFAKSDRVALLDLAKSSQLYQFDAHKVSQKQHSGQVVLVYDVNVKANALTSYNQRAAQAFGLPSADASSAIDAFKNTQQVKLFISKESRRVVRLEAVNQGVPFSIDYTNYDDAELDPEPRAALTYDEYLERLGS